MVKRSRKISEIQVRKVSLQLQLNKAARVCLEVDFSKIRLILSFSGQQGHGCGTAELE